MVSGEAWARLDHKFDLMYAKRAFVHWYVSNYTGMFVVLIHQGGYSYAFDQAVRVLYLFYVRESSHCVVEG